MTITGATDSIGAAAIAGCMRHQSVLADASGTGKAENRPEFAHRRHSALESGRGLGSQVGLPSLSYPTLNRI